MVTMLVADSIGSDKAALILFWPGFFFQQITGVGGHDEGGIFLLFLGQGLFSVGIVLAVFIAIKIWRRRERNSNS
ncbi:MAG TPA: hypothetical protein VLA83_01800 [Candidatus Binatia bacterium]|nr:hypothetical protein [Candidatus Binatia bacterium]